MANTITLIAVPNGAGGRGRALFRQVTFTSPSTSLRVSKAGTRKRSFHLARGSSRGTDLRSTSMRLIRLCELQSYGSGQRSVCRPRQTKVM